MSNSILDLADDARAGAQSGADIGKGRVVIVAALTNEVDFARLQGSFPPGNVHGMDLYGGYRDAGTLFKAAVDLSADVALIDPHLPGFSAELVQRLQLHEEKPILTIGVVPAAGDWARTLADMGAKGHITSPLDMAQIGTLLGIVPGLLKEVYAERTSNKYIPRMDPRMSAIIDKGGWQRATIAVWSPKGGVGKTFLAVNLALALGVVANRRTILIDADMNAGNVAAHLQLNIVHKNIFALANVFESTGRLTAAMVEEQLHRYNRSGSLYVLTGIPRMSVAGQSSLAGPQGGKYLAALLELLRDTLGFDFIVCDLGQSYHNEVHLTALERADKNLLVVTPEIPAVLDLHNALIPLKKYLDIDPARFKLVLNKYDEEYGVKRKEILTTVNRPDQHDPNARALGLTEFAAIPDGGRDVTLSINRHQPILAAGQRNPLSDALIGMSNGFYPYLLEIWKRPTMARAGQTLAQRLFGRAL